MVWKLLKGTRLGLASISIAFFSEGPSLCLCVTYKLIELAYGMYRDSGWRRYMYILTLTNLSCPSKPSDTEAYLKHS